MRIKEQNINKILIWLLAISVVVRGVLAAWMEFGNDEVYYWTYALCSTASSLSAWHRSSL